MSLVNILGNSGTVYLNLLEFPKMRLSSAVGHSDLLKSSGLPEFSDSTGKRSQLVICLNETSLNRKFLSHYFSTSALRRAMARFH